jgi:hypothetical protein
VLSTTWLRLPRDHDYALASEYKTQPTPLWTQIDKTLSDDALSLLATWMGVMTRPAACLPAELARAPAHASAAGHSQLHTNQRADHATGTPSSLAAGVVAISH